MTIPDLFSHLNPLLQKEIRTTFRTRRFLVSFIAVLSILGAIIFLMVIAQVASDRDIESSRIGRNIFAAFNGGLGFVTLFVLPAFSCAAFTGERERETYDMLMTTAMRPWDLVWGKLLAAFAYVFVFYTGALPLVYLCFLFGGVTPVEIFWSYLCLSLGALLIITVALMASAFFLTTKKATGSTYALIMFVAIFAGPALGVAQFGGRQMGFNFLGQIPLSVYVLVVVVYISVIIFLLLAMTNSLKASSENKSTNLRIFALAVPLAILGVGGWVLYDHLGDIGLKERAFLMTGLMLSLSVVLMGMTFVFCSEPIQRSRRVQTALMQKPRKSRWLWNLLFPGSVTGFVFTMLWGTLLIALTATGLLLLLAERDGSSIPFFPSRGTLGLVNLLGAGAACWTILLFYSSLSMCVSLFGVGPRGVRVVQVALIVITSMFPGMVAMMMSSHMKSELKFNGYFVSPVFTAVSAAIPPPRAPGEESEDYTALFMPGSIRLDEAGEHRIFFNRIISPVRVSKDSPYCFVPQFMIGVFFYLSLSMIPLLISFYRWRRLRAEREDWEDLSSPDAVDGKSTNELA